MERLADAAELLDGPLDDPEALAGNLRDLRRFNRLLGGTALSRRAIAALAGLQSDVTLLDVGTGGADIPVALIADAARRGRRLAVLAVDARLEVLAAARESRPGLDRVPGLTLEAADGRALPYPDASFDIVHASLLHHHLSPADATLLLREMARVARRGVVVNDLSRGRLALAGARVVTALLTRNRLTRHDAPLSVQRAYTIKEMRAFIVVAGLRPVAEFVGPFGHRYAIAAARA
jgi:ubiquinone/menaquinone biosynthesis C-methylase UbiE